MGCAPQRAALFDFVPIMESGCALGKRRGDNCFTSVAGELNWWMPDLQAGATIESGIAQERVPPVLSPPSSPASSTLQRSNTPGVQPEREMKMERAKGKSPPGKYHHPAHNLRNACFHP